MTVRCCGADRGYVSLALLSWVHGRRRGGRSDGVSLSPTFAVWGVKRGLTAAKGKAAYEIDVVRVKYRRAFLHVCMRVCVRVYTSAHAVDLVRRPPAR